MRVDFGILDRQFELYQTEYEAAALRVLRSGWYIHGQEDEAFEQEFAMYLGASHCVGLNSGMDALILAVRALAIGQGDEVIVPANTYIASVLGITENRATPVLVEPDIFHNLDADRIEAVITQKTKAVLVVHLYGQAANMGPIVEICKRHDLYLIEDCAQSHGARSGGTMTGLFGDVGCFSFYPTKNLGAFGDGGAVATNDREIADRIRLLRNYGSRVKYQNEIQGINSRLDELQAALLRVKLTHLESLRERRAVIVQQYLTGITNPAVELPQVRDGCEHVWHQFVIRTENRDDFQAYMLSNQVKTLIHYPIPPHLSEAYAGMGWKMGDFPITEEYASTVCSLPLFDGMRDDEVAYVIQMINGYAQR